MKEGAVLIIQPWLKKSIWSDKAVSMHRYENNSLKIARVSFVHAVGAFSVLDERYLMRSIGAGRGWLKNLVS